MNTVSGAIEDRLGRNGLVEFEGSIGVLSDDGTKIIIIPKGTTGQRPSSPEAGDIRFNTTSDLFEWWNGSAWRDQSGGTDVVSYSSLNANGGVGTGLNQVSRGNHTH